MSDLQAYIDAENAKTQAWIDAGPERMAGFIPDAEHWAGDGITTAAQLERYYMEGNIWDLYKDVNGIRPRWMDFKSMSDAELKATYDGLLVDLERHNVEEAGREAEAVKAFEAKIAELIETGAGDRETAIRWLRDAEGDEQIQYDDGYFEYSYGLPYGYLKQAA